MRTDTPSTKDDLLDAFDAAWQESAAPRLEDFLPRPASPEYPEVLVGLVCIDLERRTKAGEAARVEEYVRRFPELRHSDAGLLEVVLLERELRRRHDPDCDTAEYPARFPELASRLEASVNTLDLGAAAGGKPRRSAGEDSELDLRNHVLLERVGRGGMGEVYRGRDPALARNLAVKVLRPELCGHPEAERRFQREARINGLLQHPSIVPVHNLGRLADGRLYFTMKLVRGRTLADMLDVGPVCNRPGDTAGYKPAPRELPELLGIFEKVAQALAYAHSRKIIHRDLKPGNIMVGAFGEVQVMDWGLAKVLAAQPRTQEPAEESMSAGLFSVKPPDSTQEEYSPTGVVGTPAYMAPEQARGANEEVDERADVFGLGGILCTILTGQPPFTGERRDEVLHRAMAGEMSGVFARLEASGADSELVELASACLAAKKEDRPRDAGAVAQRVSAYLAGVQQRLHAAELERAAAQARAEESAKKAALERRARRWLLGLSAAVLLVLLAGIAGTTWGLIGAKKARDAEAQQRQIAEEKQRDAEAFAMRAAQEKDRAEKAEAATLEDYRASTDDAIEQLLGSRPAIGPREKAYLERTLKRWQAFADRTGDDERSRAIRAEGVFRVASLRQQLGQIDEALAGYREALAVYEKLAADFPDVPAHHRLLARSHSNVALLLEAKKQKAEASEHYEKALAIQRRVAQEHADVPEHRSDLARTLDKLGSLRQDQNRWKESAEHFDEALTIQQKLTQEFPKVIDYRRDLARTHGHLAVLLARRRQQARAAEQYRKAIVIQQQLTRDFPDVLEYRKSLAVNHANLGHLLRDQHRWTEAAGEYGSALILFRKLKDDFPAIPAYQMDLALCLYSLGNLLVDQEQWRKAEEHLQEALAIQQQLADGFPASPSYRALLALIHTTLGSLLHVRKEDKQAVEHYSKALTIQQQLAGERPRAPDYRHHLGHTYYNLALVLAGDKQWEKAIGGYDNALVIRQQLVKDFSHVPAYREELAQTYIGLGNLWENQLQPAKAMQQYGKALEHYEKLAKEFPRSSSDYRKSMGLIHYTLAVLLAKQRQPKQAAREYNKALELFKELANEFPGGADHRKQIGVIHHDLASLLASQRQAKQADTHFRAAVDIRQELADKFPSQAGYQVDLGGVCCDYGSMLRRNGKAADSLVWFDRAIRTLSAVVEHDGRNETARRFLRNSHWGRARALDEMKKYAEAIKEWTRVLELSPAAEQPRFHVRRADSRVRGGNVAESVAEIAEPSKSATLQAGECHDMACIYAVASSKDAARKQEYADRAMELLEKAVKAGYQDAGQMETNKDLDVLRQREDFKKLIQSLPKPKEKAPG
jgi:serine/threonine protein kinase